MSGARWIRQRFWLCLGLAMVLAGGTAATMGYLAAREAKSRSAMIIITPVVKAPQPTTKKAAGGVTARKTAKPSGTTARKRAALTTAQRRTAAAAAARRKQAAAAAADTSRRTTVTITNPQAPPSAPAPAPAPHYSRGIMWWGGGALIVGLASVAYSLHERRPKPPTSGADELLNDAPPF